MHLIIVYDINASRVSKIHKMLKEYLTWVQNSVFEGELTTSQLLEVKKRIKKIIDTQEDSVLIFSNQYSIQKEIIGQEINSTSNII